VIRLAVARLQFSEKLDWPMIKMTGGLRYAMATSVSV
jgi:hypothetical protein